ncbi:hypothetical protein AGMMS50268_31120 [Spirochaetia bacterium]|nr:hypothetical protein AGMMS50268_31120 [Spirochaetia bacterium]
MKKRFMFFAALCVVCSALGAQVFYEGQGGRNLGGIRIGEIKQTGLSGDEAELLPLIQMTFLNDFSKYAGMTVPVLDDTVFSTRYTLTGAITKTAGRYFLQFFIADNSSGTTKTSYAKQHTLEELRTLKGIKAASEELITGMGVVLTQAGKTALRTTATNEAEAMNALAKSIAAGATTFEKAYYTYQASSLDPTLAEAARRLAAYKAETYKAPEINLAMPDIRIPEIKAPEFKAPEIRMAATGNIGADARKQQEQYNAQKEVSRLRQESGNKAMKDLQDAFLAQFKIQSDAVKKQQADLLAQRDSLLGQQKTLLERQREMIVKLSETENSYAAFFTEHPPFEIIYDPAAKQVGTQDVVKGTINMRFRITSVGTAAMQVIPLMLADFEKGLGTITQGLADINAEFDKVQQLLAQVETAGGNVRSQLVTDYAAQMMKVEAVEKNYAAQLAKLDTALKTTGYAQLGRDFAVQPDTGYAEQLAREYAVRPAGYNAAGDKTMGDTWSLTKWNKDETRIFAIEARLENDAGKTIGTADVRLTNRTYVAAYTQPLSDSAFGVFHDVPVKDLTDTLKVSIQRVDGRDVTTTENLGYIKISPLEADGYTKDGWNIDGYDESGYDMLGYNKAGRDRKGRLGALQQEFNRIAGEERNARARQFAQERLGGEIWGGGASLKAGEFGFGVGADFIFRLGGVSGNSYFPLSLIAEGSFVVGWNRKEEMVTINSSDGSKIQIKGRETTEYSGIGCNVGGGLRLALEVLDFPYFSFLSMIVSGGVSFKSNDTVSPVPYLHIGTNAGPFTGGTFIRFYPDNGPGIGWYGGIKFKLR